MLPCWKATWPTCPIGRDGFATQAAERPTCIGAPHRRAALRRADQNLLMDAGRIVDRGPLEALLERSPLMRALWADAGSVEADPPEAGGSNPRLPDPGRLPVDRSARQPVGLQRDGQARGIAAPNRRIDGVATHALHGAGGRPSDAASAANIPGSAAPDSEGSQTRPDLGSTPTKSVICAMSKSPAALRP